MLNRDPILPPLRKAEYLLKYSITMENAMHFELDETLRRSASSLRIFGRSNGIVRPQEMLSTKIPKRFGIGSDCRFVAGIYSQIYPTEQQKAGFSKIGLTTIFADVNCPGIGNRIVSARSGGVGLWG
ncbi:MAG: hypothetical protein WAN13_13530, partial [Candidatus Acidiferrales bacterium]